MKQIGCLGDIVFSVSHEVTKTIGNAVWSGSVRYAEHHRHMMNALTEAVGIDPDRFSLEINLSEDFGVDVMPELFKIWEYERGFVPLTLVIGEKIYGKNKWTIVSHEMTFTHYDPNGNVKGVILLLNLLEYLDG